MEKKVRRPDFQLTEKQLKTRKLRDEKQKEFTTFNVTVPKEAIEPLIKKAAEHGVTYGVYVRQLILDDVRGPSPKYVAKDPENDMRIGANRLRAKWQKSTCLTPEQVKRIPDEVLNRIEFYHGSDTAALFRLNDDNGRNSNEFWAAMNDTVFRTGTGVVPRHIVEARNWAEMDWLQAAYEVLEIMGKLD